MSDQKQNSKTKDVNDRTKAGLALEIFLDPSAQTSSKLYALKSFKLKLALIALGLTALLFWELALPVGLQELSYREQNTSHKEQAIIPRYNKKLAELENIVNQNELGGQQISIVPTTLELIDLTNKLVAAPPQTFEKLYSLQEYHGLIGEGTKSPAQSTEHFGLAVEVMNRIIDEYPQYISDSEKTEFRVEFLVNYIFLAQSNLKDIELYRAGMEQFIAKAPEVEREKLRLFVQSRLSERFSWTEARIETARQLWMEGKSARQIATALGGTTRNSVVGTAHRQDFSGRARAKKLDKVKTTEDQTERK